MKPWPWIFAGAIAACVGVGCEPRSRNMEKFNKDDPRYNREAAPPTGLKQNPARPRSYHPGTEP